MSAISSPTHFSLSFYNTCNFFGKKPILISGPNLLILGLPQALASCHFYDTRVPGKKATSREQGLADIESASVTARDEQSNFLKDRRRMNSGNQHEAAINNSTDMVATDGNDKSKNPIVVVFAADERIAMPLAVTIQSLVANFLRGGSSYDLVMYVLDMGVSEADKEKIVRCTQQAGEQKRIIIKFIPLSIDVQQTLAALHDKKSANVHYTAASLARFMIPELLHQEHTKVIYLDADH
ncbi:MAG: glycosyltransferase [Caldilineaceae bacterium]